MSERPELSQQEVDEMKEWFDFFDKNGDQKLDRDELQRVFHAMCWVLTDEEFERIYTKADTDGNGFISYDEYLELIQTFRKPPEIERLELLEAFRHVDTDRSGTIQRNELRRFVLLSKDMAFAERDHRQLNRLISQADKNGDGVIDIEEFVDLMLEKPDVNMQKKF